MKVAINGSLGSGKSTVAKKLAEELEWKYISTGDRFRAMAKERNVDLSIFSKMAEEDSTIDASIDNWLQSFNNAEENLIIDSRMAPFFIKDALKIRLTVSVQEGARRIFADKTRGAEESFQALAESEKAYLIRSNSENKRYGELYQVNVEDESQYDLIIDTSDRTADEVCELIRNQIEQMQCAG